MFVGVDKMNDFWTCAEPYSFSDDAFARIFSFFVIECPVENVSIRGKVFNNKIALTNLNKKIRNLSPDLKELWFPIDDTESVSEVMSSNGFFSQHDENHNEIAVFTVSGKMGQTRAFLYCIRCALAHGGFCIHEYDNIKYYYFENIYREKDFDIIKARIILKETTLLDIINYCYSNNVFNCEE